MEELVNYFDYAYPKPASTAVPFLPFVAVAPSPWNRGRQVMHIGVQGFDPAGAERPPLDLVLLVDVSGSMFQPDRWPLAKASLNVLVDQLRPQDRVALASMRAMPGWCWRPRPGPRS